MIQPESKKRANAALLPLWIYVLTWIVRTSRLGKREPDAYPGRGREGVAAKGQDTAKQPTQLELYAQVIAAYQQADIWHLFNYAYVKSEKKLLAKGKFWIIGIPILAIIIYFIVSIFFYYIGMSWSIMEVGVSLFIFVIIEFLVIKDLENKLNRIFAREISHYSSLAKIYNSGGWEFYRYLLFRNELKRYNLKLQDVRFVFLLLPHEQHNLAAYVARKPLHSWIWATTGGILAASATEWPGEIVVFAVVIGGFALFILHQTPAFITNQRRQYELHRFLAWYEADSVKSTATNFNSAKPLSN